MMLGSQDLLGKRRLATVFDKSISTLVKSGVRSVLGGNLEGCKRPRFQDIAVHSVSTLGLSPPDALSPDGSSWQACALCPHLGLFVQ